MRGFPVWIAGLAIGLLGVTAAAPALGQESIESKEQLKLAFSDGVQAVRGGNESKAASLLQQVFVDTPAYIDPAEGSAAYWLGRAYEKSDQPEQAVSTWRVGIITLNAEDQFEVRLAEAFVRRVFQQKDEANYDLAAAAYLRMIKEIGQAALTEEERQALVPHLRHLSLIVPPKVKRQAGLPPETGSITPETVGRVDGEVLVAWLRGEDPLPATQRNERLREHLHRVAHARNEYASSETPSGFDDRGEIYVRYGEPRNKVSVNFNETRLTDEIYRPGVNVNLSDFPLNEFWSYGEIDRAGYYLFVKENGTYNVGSFEDLVPRRLRSNFSGSERGQRRSYLMLATLRAIYRTVGPFHPDLAARHDEVANYLAQTEDVGLTSRGEIDTDRSLNRQIRRAHTFASKTIEQTKNADFQAARKRERHMPQEATEALDDTETLDVAARTARFLNDDGTTRTELYWAPVPDALLPTEDQQERMEDADGSFAPGQYVVRLTATQKEADYRTRVVNQKHYRITGVHEEGHTIPARTFATQKGDSSLHHLSVQWDQFAVATDGDEAGLGPRLKVGTMRRDSVHALTADEQILEVSDVRPMVVPEGASGPAAASAIPYPFQTVTPETPLLLYFEVYHLPFGTNDRTRYTVEYEVNRRARGGALVRLFRNDDEESTTVTTTNEGTSRTAEEYIMLDLADWEVDTNSDVTVNVRVTDERSGQTVERSVDFRLEPAR